MRTIGLTLLLVLVQAVCASQEASPDIRHYLQEIAAGQPEDARHDLPSLRERYPDDPAVMYLQAALTTEGYEAARLYQAIVDNHPASEWADDALYKLYQFYSALNLMTTAELKLSRLRSDYPNSPYVTGKEELKPVSAAPVVSGGAVALKKDPVAAEPQHTPAEETRGRFTVQVGAFSAADRAAKMKEQMQEFGYESEVIERSRNDQSVYLVWVGSCTTQLDARMLADEIQKKYKINGMVVTR